MQVIQGMASEKSTLREVERNVPARLLRFLQRVAKLQPGRYVIIYSVGQDGDVMWQVNEAGKVER